MDMHEERQLRIDLANWQASSEAYRLDAERLRKPWQAVDAMDWDFVIGALSDGGRGRFWKAVLTEMRAALANDE